MAKRTKQEKKRVSYYDTEKEALKFVEDSKNIHKIRSKNLRQFCEFYKLYTQIPFIAMDKEDTEKEITRLTNFQGAKLFLAMINQKNCKERKEIEKLAKNCNLNMDWSMSKRTCYDYMNALKFIKNCDKASKEMFSNFVDNTLGGGKK